MLGFDNGYITIFKGNIVPHADWFSLSNARYHNTWGWYIVSTEEVPADLPKGIEPIILSWEDVSENGVLRSQSDIKKIVTKLKFSK